MKQTSERHIQEEIPWGLSSAESRSSGKVLLSGMIVLLALAVSMGVNLFRTGHLTSDQFSIGPMIQKSQDAELFTRDAVYAEASNYAFYLPYYRYLLTGLTGAAGSVEGAYWLLMSGMTAVTLSGFWLLYLDLRVRPVWAAVGAVLSALPRLAPWQEITGSGLMETALPRTFVSMCIPLVMLMFFRSRDRGWRCVFTFLVVGLLGNLHPQTAFFLTAVLLLLLLSTRYRELTGWLTATAGATASLVGIAPFMLTFRWLRIDGNKLGYSLGQVSTIEVGKALLFFRAPSALSRVVLEQILAKAEIYSNALLMLTCVLPIFVAGLLARRLARGGDSCVAARMGWRSAVIAGVLGLGGGPLFSFLSWFGFHGWLVSLHWLRALRLVSPLAMIAVVLWVGGSRFSMSRAGWGLVCTVGLVLVPVAMTVAGLEYVYFQRYYPLKEAALEAAERTPVDALVMTEPKGGCAFRFWSKRSVTGTRSDKNFMRKTGRKELKEFCAQLGKTYRKKRTKVLLTYARECGADYVVLPTGEKHEVFLGIIRWQSYVLKRVKSDEERAERRALPESENPNPSHMGVRP